MLPIHLLEKMRRLGYLKEIKYIYVSSGVAALKQCKQVLTNTFIQKIIVCYFVQIQTELPHLVVF
jgi:hypothetical protein